MRRRGGFIQASGLRVKQQEQPAKVTPEVLRAANEEQVRTFLALYEPTYRLTKIASLRFLLKQRAELGKELEMFYGLPEFGGGTYLYGRITNGFLHAALAEHLMLCEDFFAMLKFLRSPLRFAREIVSYSAGKVTNWAANWKAPERENVRRAFFLPRRELIEKGGDKEATDRYDEGLAELEQHVKWAAEDLKRWEFFYNQYKHGLKSALGHLGDLIPEALERRRQGLSGAIGAFDSLRFEHAERRAFSQPPIVIPALTPHVQAALTELHRDDNLLRVTQVVRETEIDKFVGMARYVTVLMLVLMHNRCQLGSPSSPSTWSVALPRKARDDDSPLLRNVLTLTCSPPNSLDDYQLRL